MFDTLYKKFILVTILFIFIFLAWYIKLSQFEYGLLQIEKSNGHHSALASEIANLEKLIWKMRLIEYESLHKDHLKGRDSSLLFATNKETAMEVVKTLMDPGGNDEYSIDNEAHTHPEFVVNGARKISKILELHDEYLDQLVQLNNKSKLYEARFRSNYSNLASFAMMTNDFDLFKKIYTLSKIHEGYYVTHRDNDYKAILNLLGTVEKNGVAAVEGYTKRAKLQKLFSKYRTLIGAENVLAAKSLEIGDESEKSYMELVEVISAMTASIEGLKQAKKIEANQKRKELKKDSILTASLALILLFLCLYLILKHFVGPARSLFLTIEKIKDGDSEARLDLAKIKGKGEMSQLALSLNNMLETIDYSQAELKKKVSELDSSEKELKEKHNQLSNQFDDLQSTQTQLIESEKQAALGKLVAGVAHEVNTPIGIALSYTSFLRDQVSKVWADYEKGQFKRSAFEKLCKTALESLASSEESLTRAANLIRSFKQTAADQSVESLRRFEINDYIEQSLLSLKVILKNTQHKIDFSSTGEIMVNSYPGAITQILTNLINNSLIHGYDEEQAGNMTLSTYYNEEKQLIVMTYTDDGKGMSDEVLNKMYDPFFTTNMGGGGTGLGMHIIFNLIQHNLKGTIDCKSSLGQGTEFTISIPREAQ